MALVSGYWNIWRYCLLQKILSRLRTCGSNLVLYIRYVVRQKSHSQGKSVFFDLSDPRLERYLYGLVKMFDLSGWNVALKFHPWLLLNLRNHAEWIYDVRSLKIRYFRPRDANLVIADRPNGFGILLDTAYFSKSRPTRSLRLPFLMNPSIYHTGTHEDLPQIARNKRHIKIFLGGNLDDSYENSGVENRFGIENRARIRRTIETDFADSDALVIASTREEALKILNRPDPVDLFLLRNNVVSNKEWMELLSASSFFIAPPGTLMPFSHNIIEAMAMGTIPITQYGDLFDPPLIDGKTCLVFNDKRSLNDVVTCAINATQEQIQDLRRNVINYYNDQLDPKKIVDKIDRSSNSIDRLFIIAGHLSVDDSL